MKYRYLAFLFLALSHLMLSNVAQAHHSVLAYFNMAKTAEIEGVVTKVHWRNPHIRFSVEVFDDTEKSTEWDIELSALSSFRNRGYSSAFVKVGDSVKVYGNPAYRDRPAMSGLNLLLEDGVEVILEASAGSYYARQNNAKVLAQSASNYEVEKRARTLADGIFRVWSSSLDDPDFPMFKGNYPLTDAAIKVKSTWVAHEKELESCWSKSMPYLMVSPQPIEFVRTENDILLRFEEDDAQRLIHMVTADKNIEPSLYGYSTGVWEGDTLVVETTNIDSSDFDDRGTPQGNNMHLIERFTPIDNGERLDYQITITDPYVFTEPLELARTFVWRPARIIADWDCEA